VTGRVESESVEVLSCTTFWRSVMSAVALGYRASGEGLRQRATMASRRLSTPGFFTDGGSNWPCGSSPVSSS
jgi:hypothetical protein